MTLVREPSLCRNRNRAQSEILSLWGNTPPVVSSVQVFLQKKVPNIVDILCYKTQLSFHSSYNLSLRLRQVMAVKLFF